MKCPNCGLETNSIICSNCKSDNMLYNRIHNISNVLYNKGLEQAKNNNLYEAAASLNKSLQFNKNNIDARNALGLVHYAAGRVGDAIKHWILSLNIAKTDNKARIYISEMEKNAGYMERLNESVKMYNYALTYVAQKSEDMAIIQLKKAVELNPNFIDALNLLAFSYILSKDSRKAMMCIERVLSIDINNPIAANYFAMISPDKIRTAVRQKSDAPTEAKSLQRSASSGVNMREKRTFGTGFPFAAIIWFVIGGICSFAVIYVLLMPAAISAKDEQIAQITAEYDEKKLTYDNTIAQQERSIERANGKILTLEDEKKALDSSIEVLNRTQIVLKADITLKDGDAEGAVDLIKNFSPNGLSKETIEKYNSVKEAAYTSIESTSYDEGLKLFNKRSYEEAKPFFQKSIIFATKDSGTTGNSYYYLGSIAEKDNDTDSAKTFYEKVVNDYKETTTPNLLKNAENQLNKLNR